MVYDQGCEFILGEHSVLRITSASYTTVQYEGKRVGNYTGKDHAEPYERITDDSPFDWVAWDEVLRNYFAA